MLKGINKRVIVIKNLNSEIIEEAHFILKSGKGVLKSAKGNEIVVEANRIISEYHSQQRQLADKGGIHESKADFEKFLRSSREKREEKDITPDIAQPVTNSSISDAAKLSDEEIFEDAKFLEHIQGETLPKDYFHNLNNLNSLSANAKNYSDSGYKTSFALVSARKTRAKRLKLPSKSFFVGIGVMSAIVIAIKLIEYIIGG